jgi:hypothetical protein
MNEKDRDALETKCRVLIAHLCREQIIPADRIDTSMGFPQMIALLRQALQDTYPKTKRKRLMKSIHYANAFADHALKQSAFLLDDIEQHLSRNHFLDHDRSVAYFNETIAADGSAVTSAALVETMLDSLLLSSKQKERSRNERTH